MSNFKDANTKELAAYEALKTVMDPEVGINIIDLGLVYKILSTEEQGILVEMTLSTKGCPMGDAIMDNIHSVLNTTFPAEKYTVNLVWEPAWSPDLVSQEGKKALGIIS